MNAFPIVSISMPIDVNDWYLLVMTVSFLLSISIMGPFMSSYSKGLSVMFRFNSPDADLSFPMFSPVGYVAISLLSCINLGLSLSMTLWDITEPGSQILLRILSASGVFGAACAVKLLLYQTVNSSLYKSQVTSLKPIRWNGFFIMAFSAASFIVLVLSVVVLFLSLSDVIITFGAFITLLTIEVGLFFRLKTSLFKKKYSIIGFILYLCALELGPIVLMLLLLSKTLS